MEKQEIFDLIDGLKVYDHDALDSGIKDDEKKAELKEYLYQDFEKTNVLLTEFVKTRLCDETSNYTIEDIKSLLDWLSEEMGIDY